MRFRQAGGIVTPGGRRQAGGAGSDDIIELRPADRAPDVIETGGVPLPTGQRGEHHPRRPIAALLSRGRARLVVAATQLGRRVDVRTRVSSSRVSDSGVGRPTFADGESGPRSQLHAVEQPPVDVVVASELRGPSARGSSCPGQASIHLPWPWRVAGSCMATARCGTSTGLGQHAVALADRLRHRRPAGAVAWQRAGRGTTDSCGLDEGGFRAVPTILDHRRSRRDGVGHGVARWATDGV